MAALVLLQAVENGASVRVGTSDRFLYVNDVKVYFDRQGGIELDNVSYPVDNIEALNALKMIASREHAARVLNKLFN